MMDQVAAGAEELNASVREISEAMSKSKATASTASTGSKPPISRHSSQRRGGSMRSIVQLIGDITGQINSARAQCHDRIGACRRSGPRFAVVAAEVKNLANRQAGHRQDRAGDRKPEWHFRRCRRRSGSIRNLMTSASFVSRRRGGRRAKRGHRRDVQQHAARRAEAAAMARGGLGGAWRR